MAAVALAVTSVLGFVAYQLRAPLLTRLGGLLYHEDVLEPADAIVVLGGGQLDRVIEAADLFSEGYAPVVLLTREPESPAIAGSAKAASRMLRMVFIMGIRRWAGGVFVDDRGYFRPRGTFMLIILGP